MTCINLISKQKQNGVVRNSEHQRSLLFDIVYHQTGVEHYIVMEEIGKILNILPFRLYGVSFTGSHFHIHKKNKPLYLPLHKNSGISSALFPKRPEKEIKGSFHKCMIFSSFMYIDHFLSGVTTFFLLYCIFLTSAYNLVFLGGCKNY